MRLCPSLRKSLTVLLSDVKNLSNSLAELSALRNLDKIISELQSIKNTLQAQAKSEYEERRASREHQNPPQVLRAELQIPHPKKYENETQSARDLIREKWKLYVEIFTLLVVFGYTTVAAFQLIEMGEIY